VESRTGVRIPNRQERTVLRLGDAKVAELKDAVTVLCLGPLDKPSEALRGVMNDVLVNISNESELEPRIADALGASRQRQSQGKCPPHQPAHRLPSGDLISEHGVSKPAHPTEVKQTDGLHSFVTANELHFWASFTVSSQVHSQICTNPTRLGRDGALRPQAILSLSEVTEAAGKSSG
jgi:hypothetical protein